MHMEIDANRTMESFGEFRVRAAALFRGIAASGFTNKIRSSRPSIFFSSYHERSFSVSSLTLSLFIWSKSVISTGIMCHTITTVSSRVTSSFQIKTFFTAFWILVTFNLYVPRSTIPSIDDLFSSFVTLCCSTWTWAKKKVSPFTSRTVF